jgi:hypothetical protein
MYFLYKQLPKIRKKYGTYLLYHIVDNSIKMLVPISYILLDFSVQAPFLNTKYLQKTYFFKKAQSGISINHTLYLRVIMNACISLMQFFRPSDRASAYFLIIIFNS